VVGYGIDYAEQYRSLRDIHALAEVSRIASFGFTVAPNLVPLELVIPAYDCWSTEPQRLQRKRPSLPSPRSVERLGLESSFPDALEKPKAALIPRVQPQFTIHRLEAGSSTAMGGWP
jgi:hypothetical protein